MPNRLRLLLILPCLLAAAFAQNGDRESQQRFPRVRAAYAEKLDTVSKLFRERGLPFPPEAVFFRIIKSEELLEIWAQSVSRDTFALITGYPICYFSGDLGPKRRQGDNQLPEGFYHIDRFNPASSFHLSLGINYPNVSDRFLGDKQRPGGDIFIHGNCVSIGCAAMTDELIKEIYIIAVEATSSGQQNIPVHIFPARLEQEQAWQQLREKAGTDSSLLYFWESLSDGYLYFQNEKRLPRISVTANGQYQAE